MKNNGWVKKFRSFVFENKVMLLFVVLTTASIIISGLPLTVIAGSVFERFGRNGFLVLALLVPVLAGLGLNFGLVIGAMAGQIGLFFAILAGINGIPGMLVSTLIATPLAMLFGWMVGRLFNRMKGAEMIAGLILGFFADGFYQLFFLFVLGGVIPITHEGLMLPGGIGVKNMIDLKGYRMPLNDGSGGETVKGFIEGAFDKLPIGDLITAITIAVIVYLLVRGVMVMMKKSTFGLRDLALGIAAAVSFSLLQIPAIKQLLKINNLNFLTTLTIVLIVIAVWQMARLVYAFILHKREGTEKTDVEAKSPSDVLSQSPDQKFLQKSDSRRSLLILLLCAVIYGLTYIPPIRTIMRFIRIPVFTYMLIAGVCYFTRWLLRTRIGQNMRTVGHSQVIANASGINVDRTRVIAMMISTVLACWGQLIFLQSLGTVATYTQHVQVAQFSIAALLVGGATVQKATTKNAIIGIFLFHSLFVVAPEAGKQLFNDSQIGEHFRVFISYGVIALALAMHAWKAKIKPNLGISAVTGKNDKDNSKIAESS
ncbi:MAG: ABC transporter permease [Clostridiaceae bacterium]|jgi:simple sugar transport system permease protein|nr:ABC transporter permease [Clostridia bacterium]MBP6161611.1 ABC transporter permease [Clostridia bacterium]MBP6949748.1 ABC transporter permease [Clostridia bacterium]NMA35900.1 ABC transporter permease [Clostridiaceae bacterium]